MNKRRLFVVTALAVLLTSIALIAQAVAFDSVYIYKNKRARENNFAPSGWMGDISDIKYNDGWPMNPKAGASCIKVIYAPSYSSSNGWAGIYWQDPPNNWGTDVSKYDLSGAKKLSFWIRGEKGGEVINDIFVGGINGRYSDTCSVAIGPIELTTDWVRYEINLEDQDLSHIIGGFGWSTNISANPDGCVFYLDEIKFE